MKRQFLFTGILLLAAAAANGQPTAIKKNDGASKAATKNKEVTITVSYAAIECGCAQWFDSKYTLYEYVEKKQELFYLEPANKKLINANRLWDGEHLPLTLKVTGHFSHKKELPVSTSYKGIPPKAPIFWYDKIKVISK